MSSKRKTGAVVSVALVVVAVAAATWWWTSRDVTDARPVPSQSPSAPQGTGDAEQAAAALAQLTTDPGALLPAELEAELGATVGQAVPAGTTVLADPATWLPSAAGGGVIHAELTFPDGSSSTVAAVMVLEPDGWKVLQTIAMDPTS
jgi:hypothetical protein